jgi:nucleoside phosphorylase
MQTRRPFLVPAVLLGAALFALAALSAEAADTRGGLCAALKAKKGSRARLAVLSAFPRELAPLVSWMRGRERIEIAGRPFYLGTLGRVRVVVGMTRIGMVNAAETAELLLENFDIAGFVFSGVAGSEQQIADVVVSAEWRERATGMTFPTNPFLLELARRATCGLALERCTLVTFSPPVETVCFPRDPVVVVGGVGISGDPFVGRASSCTPNPTGPLADLTGCDIAPPVDGEPPPRVIRPAVPCGPSDLAPTPGDMETAAVARVAAEHGVPLLGVRGMSDGAGDPRGERGFPTQFFDYYHLAADNAAVATIVVLDRFARLGGRSGSSAVCRALARERWDRAVRLLRPRS